MRILAAVGLLLLLASPAAAQDRRALHWGIACSVAADAADLLTTYHAFDRRPDAVEGNFLYGDTKDRNRFLAIKATGAAVLNGVAVWLHDDYPKPSLWLVYGNCALKAAFAVHNLRVAHGRDRPRAALAIQLRW